MATRLLKVEPINPLDECDVEHDSIDVHATLRDGRIYMFEVATPNCVYDWMANNSKRFYVGEPTVFVDRLTLENITRAIQAIVDSDSDALETYGTLQTFSV